MFAGRDLVARIERAECELLTESTRAAARREPSPSVVSIALGGGTATWSAPSSPLNKLAGIGLAEGLDLAQLEAQLTDVERAFEQRGTPVQVELPTHADPAVGRMLTGRGYRLEGFEDVLGRPLSHRTPEPPAPTTTEIHESAIEDLGTWLDTVVDGFAHPDTQGLPSHEEFPREALERDLGDMAHVPGFLRFVARRAGAVAGAASMRITDDIAQLCGATTLPEHRRRGVQSALLGHRLALAAERGCRVAVVTTQPGSKSQQNVQRQGFALLYSRAVLVKSLQ